MNISIEDIKQALYYMENMPVSLQDDLETEKKHESLEHNFANVLTAVADQHKLQEESVQAKPFVKWVGGKRSIVKQLTERIPTYYTKYYEPFIGGGALFFELQPEYAQLSDINFYLIITYQVVRDNVDRLVCNLRIHKKKHCKKYYLKARVRLNKEKDPVKIAGLFIYINKTCFNGLYRVNKSGGFNVAMGAYKNPQICDEENLRNASQLLQGVEIQQLGFNHTSIQKDAFYYIDPPYYQAYSSYDRDGFGDQEHKKLVEFCRKIDAKGGYFMVSNSDTPFVRKLYKGFHIEIVSASRFVSRKAHQRGKENELIIRNYK